VACVGNAPSFSDRSTLQPTRQIIHTAEAIQGRANNTPSAKAMRSARIATKVSVVECWDARTLHESTMRDLAALDALRRSRVFFPRRPYYELRFGIPGRLDREQADAAVRGRVVQLKAEMNGARKSRFSSQLRFTGRR
jgi:hypothetical protein